MKETTLTLTAEQKKKLDGKALDAIENFVNITDYLMKDDLEMIDEVIEKGDDTDTVSGDDLVHIYRSISRHLRQLCSVYCILSDHWSLTHGNKPEFDTLDVINQEIRDEAKAREETAEAVNHG